MPFFLRGSGYREGTLFPLYDRPYEDKGRVRVAGPFRVESLSPHRVVPADDLDDELIDTLDASEH